MRVGRDAWLRVLLFAAAVGGCSTPGPSASTTVATSSPPIPPATTAATTAPTATTGAAGSAAALAPITLLLDTDVADDDLVALSFLISAPNVTIAAITVSGTGEAHCAGGVDVVLRLLDRFDAPDIPVACGRETPLAGSHAFPTEWRERVDVGSGLRLQPTTRKPASSTAVELIVALTKQHEGLHVLTLSPLTNLADAMLADAGLAARLGPVYVMGGALHVPGNLVCCGAPLDNDVAEWNVYVDPHAVNVVVDSGITPLFVSLDGTNQVPLTPAFAARAMEPNANAARGIVAELFTANPFMIEGSFYLWDPMAAMIAAGYPIGLFSPAAVEVEEAEGPESGFTRPVEGVNNIRYLVTVDARVAEDTLLAILNRG